MKTLLALAILLPSIALAESPFVVESNRQLSPERAERIRLENALIRSIIEQNVAETELIENGFEYFPRETGNAKESLNSGNAEAFRSWGNAVERKMETDRILRESR